MRFHGFLVFPGHLIFENFGISSRSKNCLCGTPIDPNFLEPDFPKNNLQLLEREIFRRGRGLRLFRSPVLSPGLLTGHQ